jgi:hypothetical protein
MKKILLFLVLFGLIGLVSSQGYDPAAAAAQSKAQGTWFSIIINAFSLGIFSAILQVAGNFIFVGGIAAFAFLGVMQYLGFDLVGWTIEIVKFGFDNVFLLIRWTLSNESNLISMVILFILLWLIILGFIPTLFVSPPTTIIYQTVSTTTTTLPWWHVW